MNRLLLPLLLCAVCAAAEPAAAVARLRYERIAGEAVVTGHGTAFAVDLAAYGREGKRYLLTAAHNVLDDATRKPYDTLILETAKLKWCGVKVLAFNVSLDLCLLECTEELPAVLSLADKEAAHNTAIELTGSKRGKPLTVHTGTVVERFERGTVRTRAAVAFDHGDSGGPVTAAGAVVGVAVAGIPKDGDLDTNVCLFVPLIAIRSFLDQHLRAGK